MKEQIEKLLKEYQRILEVEEHSEYYDDVSYYRSEGKITIIEEIISDLEKILDN
jgi:hypothetical protein